MSTTLPCSILRLWLVRKYSATMISSHSDWLKMVLKSKTAIDSQETSVSLSACHSLIVHASLRNVIGSFLGVPMQLT